MTETETLNIYKEPIVENMGWKELSVEEKEFREKCLTKGPKTDIVRFDNGFLFKRRLALNFKNIQNFPYREDDVLIMSHPKAGSTWAQETVWLMLNNLDIVKSKKIPKRLRSPALKKINDPKFGEQFFENMEGRRVIKCHIPFPFLPDNILERCKVIYMARNPKDLVVSFYHHLKRKGHTKADFHNFAQLFKAELLHYSYWNHLHSAWQRRTHKNLKMLWFEDMKADTAGAIEEMAEFLNHPISSEQKNLLCEYVKFDNMKKNENAYNNSGVNNNTIHFMRKGIVGDWKNHFDATTNQEYNQWILEKINSSGMDELKIFKQIIL